MAIVGVYHERLHARQNPHVKLYPRNAMRGPIDGSCGTIIFLFDDLPYDYFSGSRMDSKVEGMRNTFLEITNNT
jgi:hypothetical protein